MKILVICQHYWPEPYPLTDICEELVKRGHLVHVVTDVPNYPMGRTYKEYTGHKRRNEEHNGVQITRTFTIPRHHGAVLRLMNYYSYSISSTMYVKRIKEDYDVVFTNQTSPVMMSNAAFVYANIHHRKAVMYCMDLWPACLAAGGLTEKSVIYKLFGKISGKLYRKADLLLVSSQMFVDYLVQQHGVKTNRIRYLPQYAPMQFNEINVSSNNKETVDLMFAGNIGAAQNLVTILNADEMLLDYKQLRIHIVGDGSELYELKRIADSKKLNNVIFYGRRPAEDMPILYAMADAMLITLTADKFISLTLPGKMQTYMAARKPIIGVANGEIPQVINDAGCGFCVNAENAEELAKIIRKFMDLSAEERHNMGSNARKYYVEHFTKTSFIDTLEKYLVQYAVGEANES